MVTYVVVNLRKKYESGGQGFFTTKLRLEQDSGQPCLIQFFEDVSVERIRELSVKAMVVSGFGADFREFDLQTLVRFGELLKQCPVPTLTVCGSHQLLGFAFTNDLHRADELLAMRRLRPGEPDVNPDYHPGFLKEAGYYRVKILRRDPLFDGLKGSLTVREAHMGELKRLPSGFTLLASSPLCRIQAMRHERLPLRSVQFHPEGYTDYYPDGKRVLENFFKWAQRRIKRET
jgi:GMP synthase-like glutamine amidotransferase